MDLLAVSDVPVTVIYGLRDSVVPPELSARVADQAPCLAERVVLAEADHNQPVMFGSRVADAVERLPHAAWVEQTDQDTPAAPLSVQSGSATEPCDGRLRFRTASYRRLSARRSIGLLVNIAGRAA